LAAVYALAEVLHKTAAEIGQLSRTEFLTWCAHFKRKEERRGRE